VNEDEDTLSRGRQLSPSGDVVPGLSPGATFPASASIRFRAGAARHGRIDVNATRSAASGNGGYRASHLHYFAGPIVVMARRIWTAYPRGSRRRFTGSAGANLREAEIGSVGDRAVLAEWRPYC